MFPTSGEMDMRLVQISTNDTILQRDDVPLEKKIAFLYEIPEPSTLVLLGLGIMMSKRKR